MMMKRRNEGMNVNVDIYSEIGLGGWEHKMETVFCRLVWYRTCSSARRTVPNTTLSGV